MPEFYAPHQFQKAVSDFHDARMKAEMEYILSVLRINRKPAELLSYDEVRNKLRAVESSTRKLQEIPINAIVGSVNRYTDFTRSFLPLLESDKDRWARVRAAVERMAGLPPIEVYRVGEAYFVLDGHHRVSVARELGQLSIEAYVIPVQTRVPLSPGDKPDDIIIKSEYADFLAATRIDDLRPDVNLLVTAPGQYQKLLEHINVHRYFMGEREGREIPFQDAVTNWFDTVYQPMAQMIRDRNLLRDFPGRTETDLYLWIMEHRAALGGSGIGWEVSPERAAADLSKRYSPLRRLSRLTGKLSDIFIPDPLRPGPPTGQWRAEHQAPHRGDHLFDDILVTVPSKAIRKDSGGWQSVNAAVEVARREEARLTGIHIVAEGAPKESEEIEKARQEFLNRCGEAGIFGRLVVETSSSVAQLVCQRSPFVDLVVYRMNFPPPTKPLARLRSGARLMIRRCSSPILAVTDAPFKLDSALLAFGPGQKSEEALYVATYLAGRWNMQLTVVTGKTDSRTDGKPTPLERARSYLELHEVQATYVQAEESPAQAILINAEKHNSCLIVMGGYEKFPLREALVGSTVDRVLRSTRRPVLICR